MRHEKSTIQGLIKEKQNHLKKGNLKAAADVASEIADEYKKLGRLKDRLECHLEEVDLCERSGGSHTETAIAYRHLVESYSDLRLMDKAQPAMDRYLDLSKKSGDLSELQAAYHTLAKLMLDYGLDAAARGDEKSKLKYLKGSCSWSEKSEHLYNQLANQGSMERKLLDDKFAGLYCNWAEAKYNLGHPLQEALDMLHKALSKTDGTSPYRFLSLYHLTEWYLEIGNVSQAKAQAVACVNAVPKHMPEELADALLLKSKTLVADRNIREARIEMQRVYAKLPRGSDRTEAMVARLRALVKLAAFQARLDMLERRRDRNLRRESRVLEKLGDSAISPELAEYQFGLSCYEKAVELSCTLNRSRKVISALYVSCAMTCDDMGNHQRSLDFYLKELALHENVDPDEAWTTLTNICAQAHFAGRPTDELVGYFEKSMDLASSVSKKNNTLKRWRKYLLDTGHLKTSEEWRRLRQYSEQAGVDIDETHDSSDSDNEEAEIDSPAPAPVDSGSENSGSESNLSDLDEDRLSDLSGLEDEPGLAEAGDVEGPALARNWRTRGTGPRKTRINDVGETALHVAAKEGQHLKLRKLLEMNYIDINHQDNNGWTAIHEAANRPSLECVVLLVEAGANLNLRGQEGLTPMMDAATGGALLYEDVLRYLMSNGADVTLKSDVGYDVLNILEDWYDGEVRNKTYSEESANAFSRLRVEILEQMAKAKYEHKRRRAAENRPGISSLEESDLILKNPNRKRLLKHSIEAGKHLRAHRRGENDAAKLAATKSSCSFKRQDRGGGHSSEPITFVQTTGFRTRDSRIGLDDVARDRRGNAAKTYRDAIDSIGSRAKRKAAHAGSSALSPSSGHDVSKRSRSGLSPCSGSLPRSSIPALLDDANYVHPDDVIVDDSEAIVYDIDSEENEGAETRIAENGSVSDSDLVVPGRFNHGASSDNGQQAARSRVRTSSGSSSRTSRSSLGLPALVAPSPSVRVTAKPALPKVSTDFSDSDDELLAEFLDASSAAEAQPQPPLPVPSPVLARPVGSNPGAISSRTPLAPLNNPSYRIKVRMGEDFKMLLQITDVNKPIQWLLDEAGKRYFLKHERRPRLVFETVDGCELGPQDPLSVVAGVEEEIIAKIEGFEDVSLKNRYEEIVKNRNMYGIAKLKRILAVAETSGVLDLADPKGAFNGEDTIPVFRALMAPNIMLTKLVLSNCCLNDSACVDLAKAVAWLHKLICLELINIGLHTARLEMLVDRLRAPDAFVGGGDEKPLQQLTHLSLSQNCLCSVESASGQSLAILGRLLSMCPKLVALELDEVGATPMIFGCVPLQFECSTLLTVSLSRNKLGPSGVAKALSLFACSPVETIRLDGVCAGSDDFGYICDQLQLCSPATLKHLSVGCNGARPTDVEALCQLIHKSPNLISLNLNGNKSLGNDAFGRILKATLGSHLVELSLDSCAMTWPLSQEIWSLFAQKLDPAVPSAQRLAVLALSICDSQFSQTELREIDCSLKEFFVEKWRVAWPYGRIVRQSALSYSFYASSK